MGGGARMGAAAGRAADRTRPSPCSGTGPPGRLPVRTDVRGDARGGVRGRPRGSTRRTDPVPNDAYELDDFLIEWNAPNLDRESSTAVLDDDGRVVAFSFLLAAGSAGSTASLARCASTGAADWQAPRSGGRCARPRRVE